MNEDGEEESNEYVILKCSVDENGEDILETIEDDEEFDEVAEIFEARLADLYEIDVVEADAVPDEGPELPN